MLKYLKILASVRVRHSVEGVMISLEPNLVTVEDCGNTRKGHKHRSRGKKTLFSARPFLCTHTLIAQLAVREPRGILSAKHRQNSLGIVSANEIHLRVHNSVGRVLGNLRERVAKLIRRLSQNVIYNTLSQRIIHYSVKL